MCSRNTRRSIETRGGNVYGDNLAVELVFFLGAGGRLSGGNELERAIIGLYVEPDDGGENIC